MSNLINYLMIYITHSIFRSFREKKFHLLFVREEKKWKIYHIDESGPKPFEFNASISIKNLIPPGPPIIPRRTNGLWEELEKCISSALTHGAFRIVLGGHYRNEQFSVNDIGKQGPENFLKELIGKYFLCQPEILLLASRISFKGLPEEEDPDIEAWVLKIDATERYNR